MHNIDTDSETRQWCCTIKCSSLWFQCRRKTLTSWMQGTVLRVVCVCMCAFYNSLPLLYCWIPDFEDQEWWFTL